MLTIPTFLFIWAFCQAAVTLWIAFFVTEEKIWDDDNDEEEELTVMPNQIFGILKDIVLNKNLLYYFAFVLLTGPSFQFNAKVSQLYLTDELKFSRASVQQIRLLSTPANLICSVLSGYFASARPFTFFYWISVISLVFASYSILINIRYFPTDQVEQ
jgi:Na+/melibiose symporter-like transporter